MPTARQVVVVQPQVVQRLARVVVRLAARDEAEARVRRIDHGVVQLVRAHVRERRVPLVFHQPRFLLERRIGPADVQAAWRHRRSPRAARSARGRGSTNTLRRRLDDLLDRLHARPHAREAAHRERVQTHVEDVLHARRKEHRQPAGLEDVVALMRGGAALGDVVVAGDRDHAAVLRGARHVGVLEDVRASVDARALAVPDAEHAVELLALRIEVELLRPPDRGRAELLVDPRLEDDVLCREVLLRGPQRLVVAAERRAAVAADEARGVQPGERVALALQHRQTHQRLHAAHEGAARFDGVFVVQRHAFERLADRLGQRCVHATLTPAAAAKNDRECRVMGRRGLFFLCLDMARSSNNRAPRPR